MKNCSKANPSDASRVLAPQDSRGGRPSLVTGDVIHSLNGTPIDSLNRLRSGLDQLKPHSPAVLQIERDGKLMFVDFQLD